MKMKSSLFTAFLMLTLAVNAQVDNVSPKPHEVTLGEIYDCPSKPIVVSGIVGKDKSVKKYKKLVPEKAESYYLSIDKKGKVVIAARDAQGLFYGQQTYLQIRENGKLQECTISDWPDVTWRGVVEGFYGQPWSHMDRMRQLFFYGQNKMNVYIYGPKDDPYHREHWRVPYPQKEAKQIQELVECAKQNHVKFYWAIHPGGDIKWDDSDRDSIIFKFEKMYQLGVRSFAVFFDDIWGEGAKGDKQAALLNYIDDQFVKVKGDVSPLVLCPTEYNRAWSSDNSEYLHSLGSTLNKSIEVMWTGNSVVHCIDKESMEWINQRLQRKAYIWWNFPVNDFVRDHMLLGPAYGNGLDIADDVSGFVSNPMQYAESSKLALYNIADYTWNMQAYDYQQSWEKALVSLMPETNKALRTFAIYNEDLGPNGHAFRREESREIKPIADAAVNGDKAAIAQLKQKCNELKVACKELLESSDNSWLIDELRPWILQSINVALYGDMICSMAINPDLISENYEKVKHASKVMYNLENNKDMLHPYQTGIKTATLVLLPALNKLFHDSVLAYNERTGQNLDPVAEYLPLHLTATVPQLANQPISMRGKTINITPSNEVITWPVDSHLDISFDEEFTLNGLDFNFGTPDQAQNFRLETLDADGNWHPVSLSHYTENEPIVHTGGEIQGMKAKALRLTNISGKQLQLYFRSFRFDVK